MDSHIWYRAMAVPTHVAILTVNSIQYKVMDIVQIQKILESMDVIKTRKGTENRFAQFSLRSFILTTTVYIVSLV